MNYKQKQRIKQLTESTLITGADIAKLPRAIIYYLFK